MAAGAAPAAAADEGSYAFCTPAVGTRVVQVARTTCAEAQRAAVAVGVARGGGEQDALAAVGWTAVRAADMPGDVHDIVAVRDRAVVRVRRAGAAPDLDGWAAGRELVFARGGLQGGARVPRNAAVCTSAFLIRLNGRTAGLSAGHCAGLRRRDNTAQLHSAGLRRPPQPGIVLGRVLRLLNRTAPYDALALPAPTGRGRTTVPVVDRGIRRPPWIVAGTARPTSGRRVCFTGRTSGVDRCGRIARNSRGVERLLRRQAGVVERCTTIDGAQGDSGGPVYTAPRADGTVRALGIVSLGVGFAGNVCFTPIAPVLERLDATLVRG
ncbi:MAG TPA: hypothetical protein VFZ89_09350 [Solirubrobacteraceae bacterium]